MNLLACGEKTDNTLKDGTIDGEITVDADGDGYLEDEDCDDNNPAIYPSAEEVTACQRKSPGGKRNLLGMVAVPSSSAS